MPICHLVTVRGIAWENAADTEIPPKVFLRGIDLVAEEMKLKIMGK